MEELNLKDWQQVMEELQPKREARVSEGFKEKLMQQARQQYMPEPTKRLYLIRKVVGWSVAAMVAAVCLIGVFTYSLPLSAHSLLEAAIINFRDIRTMVMDIDIRTRPQENFSYISPEEDFVRHKLQVRYDEPMRWRMEKIPGRVALGEGEDNYFWWTKFKLGNYMKGEANVYLGYLSILLQPKEILQRELDDALKNESVEYTVKNKGDETILTVHSLLPEEENPYRLLLNRAMESSENIRKYIFDRKTKRLKNLEVCMVVDGQQIEVIRTRRIVYNVELGRATLLELPADVKIDSILGMTGLPYPEETAPEEVARIIFESMAPWDETVMKPVFGNLEPLFRKGLEGSRLIEIGTAFKEGKKKDFFVPYKILLPDGNPKEGNITLWKSRSGWLFNGGL